MASVALDPRLFAPPNANASADAFRAFVSRLSEWKTFAKEKGCTITLSRDTQARLIDDDAYPLAVSLRDNLKAKGIVEYDFPTLKVFCEGFFKFKPCFQEHVGIAEILHERSLFSPALAGSQPLPNTTSEAEKNLVTLAILNHCHCRSPNVGFALQSSIDSNRIHVSAYLHAIDTHRTDLIANESLPSQIVGTVAICSDLNEFVRSCDFGTLFQNTVDDDQLRLCIKLAIFRSRQQRNIETDWDELPAFKIGTEFRQRALNVAGEDVGLCFNIVRSIVDAVDSLNLPQTHALRTGDGPNDPQRTFKGVGAWRRDITREVHLHYWKGPKNLIEIGWLSHPHDDMYLPNPCVN